MQDSLQPMQKDTWRKFAVPCPWLETRIKDREIRERYGVFCYNNPARKSAFSGRVMLPVKDSAGLLYGYLGRYTRSTDTAHQSNAPDTDIPKYLFPRNLPKSRFLFGAHELGTFGQAPLKRVYLLESPFAVMKFASLDLPVEKEKVPPDGKGNKRLACIRSKGKPNIHISIQYPEK